MGSSIEIIFINRCCWEIVWPGKFGISDTFGTDVEIHRIWTLTLGTEYLFYLTREVTWRWTCVSAKVSGACQRNTEAAAEYDVFIPNWWRFTRLWGTCDSKSFFFWHLTEKVGGTKPLSPARPGCIWSRIKWGTLFGNGLLKCLNLPGKGACAPCGSCMFQRLQWISMPIN